MNRLTLNPIGNVHNEVIAPKHEGFAFRYNCVQTVAAVAHMLVKMETYFDGEFWCARGTGEDIFTQGKTLDELYHNIKEAVPLHFGETGSG